jgi:hypothetical protein
MLAFSVSPFLIRLAIHLNVGGYFLSTHLMKHKLNLP